MPNYKHLIELLKDFEHSPNQIISKALDMCRLLKQTKYDFSHDISTMEVQMGMPEANEIEGKQYYIWLHTNVNFKACDYGKIKDIVRDEYESMLEKYLVIE